MMTSLKFLPIPIPRTPGTCRFEWAFWEAHAPANLHTGVLRTKGYWRHLRQAGGGSGHAGLSAPACACHARRRPTPQKGLPHWTSFGQLSAACRSRHASVLQRRQSCAGLARTQGWLQSSAWCMDASIGTPASPEPFVLGRYQSLDPGWWRISRWHPEAKWIPPCPSDHSTDTAEALLSHRCNQMRRAIDLNCSSELLDTCMLTIFV